MKPLQVGEIGVLQNYEDDLLHLNGAIAEVDGPLDTRKVNDIYSKKVFEGVGYGIHIPIETRVTFCYQEDIRRLTDPDKDCRKKHKPVKIEYKGEALTIKQASKKYGIKVATIYSRLNLHWPIEKILTMPVRQKEVSS